MHACTMFLLPWGSLVAMEFSDPETKPNPNQLADIHMHSFELLITKPNSTSRGGDSSLKMNQTVRSQNVWKIQCFGWLQRYNAELVSARCSEGFDEVSRFGRCKFDCLLY